MPNIFHRFPGGDYDQALDDLTTSRTAYERAMGRNVVHDPRVPTLRKQRFDSSFSRAPVTVEDLKHQMSPDYMPWLEHYRDRNLNQYNLVPLATGEKDGLLKSDRLVHALKFNRRTLDYLRDAHNEDPGYFAAFPDTPDAYIPAEWFERKLEDPDQRETFITAALRALNDFRDPTPPVWCTTERDFRSHFNKSADRWLELLGVATPQRATWVILVLYHVWEAQRLFRPTVLESGWYAQHFPSPPNGTSPTKDGGFTMDLGAASTELLREFVHSPVALQARHWRDTGQHCRQASGGTKELTAQRSAHYRLLIDEFGETEIMNWMSQPI